MRQYSEEFRASIAARLLPPNSAKASDIARETGVPENTLYGWKSMYRNRLVVADVSDKSTTTAPYSADEKFRFIIATATLNELELSEYCRSHGIYPSQIELWKSSILQSLTSEPSKADRQQSQKQIKTIQQLEKELSRKEKALAEVAALLVLQKKFHAFMEVSEGSK